MADQDLVTVTNNENPPINLEITSYKNIVDVNFFQSIESVISAHNASENAHQSEFSLKANTTDMNTALATKANISTTYSKTETDTLLNAKINTLDTTITKQGNTFNGTNQLVQLNSSGQLPAINGSLLTGITNFAIQKGSCSTASATAEKVIALSGFSLSTGSTIQVTFTSANTAATPTLNVNSTGAKSVYSEDGTVCSSTNPFYVPTGATVEFTYNGNYWIYKNRVITNYYNNGSFYRVWTNGFIEQGGVISTSSSANIEETITFLKAFSDTNYKIFKNVNISSSYKNDAGWYQGIYRCYNLTSTTFTTMNTTATYITNSDWYACGF